VVKIFNVAHFRQRVGNKQLLDGHPVADPFVIASARVRGGCVVTEEQLKPNAARIPNVCDHFKVACTNVRGFLKQNGWKFRRELRSRELDGSGGFSKQLLQPTGGFFDARPMRGGILTERALVGVGCDRSRVVKSEMSG
jgi:hypothetical protein